MTSFTKRIGLLAGAAVLTAGLGSAYLSAQDNSGGTDRFRGRGPMGRFGGPGGPGGPGGAMGMPMHRLNLTDSQRTQVKAVLDSHREETTAIGERMRTARKALQDAISADQFDESAVRARSADLAAVEADMAVLRARIHGDMWQLLTPDQQKQAKTLRAQMEQRMERRRQNRDERRR